MTPRSLSQPKTPKAMQAWNARRRDKMNARALTALEYGLMAMKQFHSWRQIEFNAPPGSKVDQRARDEAQKAAMKAANYFDVVRRALGYEPEAEPAPPKRHWDAGA